MKARGLLSVLFHAEKALDLIQTARDLGIIARLDCGPVTLAELAETTGARPLRLYKFLDGLESLGLIIREQTNDDFLTAQYGSREPPLAAVVDAVLGERSIERDRDKYPWRAIHGRLADVMRGQLDTEFAWPPRNDDDVFAFEASMAAGCGPIVEALGMMQRLVFEAPSPATTSRRTAALRWLDIGGGDGTVAEALLSSDRSLACDVYNLPAVAPLVAARARAAGLEGRLGFVGGDFLREPLPQGYGMLSFIRVLHDWPPEIARALLVKAREALGRGGRIVICEEFRTPDRLAVQFFWTYFLTGADSCVSRLREVQWYTDALTSLEFRDVRVIRGGFDLVTAVVE